MNIALKVFGTAILLAGLVLTYKPGLISRTTPPSDAYAMIEARVRWGFLIGIGLFIILNQNWIVAWLTLYEFGFYIILGIIIARTAGMLLDGTFPKQWLWLGIEFAILLVFAFLMRSRDPHQ